MTRFTYAGDKRWGAGDGALSFPVLTENQAGFDAFAEKAADAVEKAVELLDGAISALDMPMVGRQVKTCANKYFLTGPNPSRTDLAAIRTVLNQTRTGLKSKFMAVKILAVDPKSTGYVNGKAGGRIHKSYHNVQFMTDTQQDERQGAIHIDGERLAHHLLSAKTMIHEASHKFAGTRDYRYFDDLCEKPEGEFTDKEKAMQNADSFACFALRVGG